MTESAKPVKVLLPKDAQKDFKRLGSEVHNSTTRILERLAQNPNLAKKLSGDLSDVYSYRFGTPTGEFRVAFVLQQRKLFVIAIGPREGFYDRLKRRL